MAAAAEAECACI